MKGHPISSFQVKSKEEVLLARIRELEEALLQHRADLHCYSSRPCPTCQQSAKVLGIEDKVPDSCAKERWDTEALKKGAPDRLPDKVSGEEYDLVPHAGSRQTLTPGTDKWAMKKEGNDEK